GLSGAASQTKSQIRSRRSGPPKPSFHRPRAGCLRGRRTRQHRRSESRHTGQYKSLSVADQERRSLRFLPLLLRTLALGIPPLARILLSFDRIWRALWPDGWFRLQLIQQFRHTAFQLRVFALDDRFRIIFDRDVGVNAVAFDYPIAFSVG